MLPKQPVPAHNSIECPFIATYYNFHRPNRAPVTADDQFLQAEKMFLSIFQVGMSEAYIFLYQYCQNPIQFELWLIEKRGLAGYQEAVNSFNNWCKNPPTEHQTFNQTLSQTQMASWAESGYLQISGLVNPGDCDDVVDLMCATLVIDINEPASWYPNHEQLQGMMLVRYQDEAIAKIRNNEKIKQVFAQLYNNANLYPNTEKLSYNPPENSVYQFLGSPLHWDIDFKQGVQYYIQGLVYLNDVPENRGPLTLIPGFQHQIESFLQRHPDPETAIKILKSESKPTAIAGKKGDLILWLQALPHAASPNRSTQPRFVQYVSYIKA